MLDAQMNFETRKREVERYFAFLALTQEFKVSLRIDSGIVVREEVLDSDIKTILKANAFLILYNMVESTVKDGIRAIFNGIKADSLTYAQVHDTIRRLWVSSKYRHLEISRAAHDKYTDIAKAIVDDVIASPIVEFANDYDCGISGNLDAMAIRKLAERYGFSASTSPKTYGGRRLQTVKERRNDLAHGSVSFVECGRDYTLSDLQEIKSEVIQYLDEILGNIGAYVSSQQYRELAGP